jgi:protocatechuate 3,4-dioxygenase beta subunit
MRTPAAILIRLVAIPSLVVGAIVPLAPLAPLATSGGMQARGTAETTTVEGRITDVATGEPVGGAWVLLESQTKTVNPLAVETRADGRYRLFDIPPDTYHLRVDAPGFRVLRTAESANLLPIRTTSGAVIVSDYELSRGATIAGRVSDASGAPVVAEVWAEYDTYSDGQSVRRRHTPDVVENDADLTRTFARRMPTDAEGRFTIVGLGEGAYYLAAFVDPDSPIYYPGTSVPSAAAPVQVTADMAARAAVIGGIEIPWRPVPTVPVRGRITGADDPGSFVVRIAQDLPNTQFPVDATGHFDVSVPPHRQYDLMISRSIAPGSGGFPSSPPALDTGTVSIHAGDAGVDDLLVTVAPAIGVDGEFLWESTPTRNMDWGRVRVGFEMRFGNGRSAYWVSASDGRIHLESVRPVPQHLDIDGLPGGTYVESAFYGPVDALRGEINPADVPDARLRIRLGNQPAGIEGTVVGPDGDPVPGAVVSLVPDADRRGRRDLFRTIPTDEEGRFRFDTVAPGTYLVFGWSSIADGAIQNETFRLPYEPRATRVYVDRSGFADVEVGLIE